MKSTLKLLDRTSRGLVEALFDTIDRLNAKEIDAEQARAISHTARTIVNVAQLELEYRKWAEGTDQGLISLQLEKPEKPEKPE
jgi:hypothetical protein